MGIENAFLRKLPGLVFILAGLLSQIYLARKAPFPRIVSRVVTGVYLCACLIINFEIFKDPPRPFNYILDRISSGLTFFGWITAFIAIVFMIRTLILARLERKQQTPKAADRVDLVNSRRQFLNVAAGVVCAAPAVALGTGVLIRKDFQVKEFDLKIPGLAKDLQGLRLLQLSDIHMGTYFSQNDLRRVVDASNNLRADLGFITGDLISTVRDPLDECLMELKRLKASSGLWGCMGNHERVAKVENYAADRAREQDLFFLRHDAQSLRFGANRINIVGVDHQFKNKGYLRGVHEMVRPDEFNLLLSHNPDVFPVAAEQGFQLTLSGHTHGGQINLEVAHTNLNIVDLVTPYTKGLYQKAESSLYVTSGLGTIGVPVRLGAPPEITLIRLCAS